MLHGFETGALVVGAGRLIMKDQKHHAAADQHNGQNDVFNGQTEHGQKDHIGHGGHRQKEEAQARDGLGEP